MGFWQNRVLFDGKASESNDSDLHNVLDVLVSDHPPVHALLHVFSRARESGAFRRDFVSFVNMVAAGDFPISAPAKRIFDTCVVRLPN